MFKRLLWTIFITTVAFASFVMVEHFDWLVLPPIHQYAPSSCIEGDGPDHLCTSSQPPEPQPSTQPISIDETPIPTMPVGWK